MAETTPDPTAYYNFVGDFKDQVIPNEKRALMALMAQQGSNALGPYLAASKKIPADRAKTLNQAAARGAAINTGPPMLTAQESDLNASTYNNYASQAEQLMMLQSQEYDRISNANSAALDQIGASADLYALELDAQQKAALLSGGSGGGGGGGGGGSGSDGGGDGDPFGGILGGDQGATVRTIEDAARATGVSASRAVRVKDSPAYKAMAARAAAWIDAGLDYETIRARVGAALGLGSEGYRLLMAQIAPALNSRRIESTVSQAAPGQPWYNTPQDRQAAQTAAQRLYTQPSKTLTRPAPKPGPSKKLTSSAKKPSRSSNAYY